MRLVSEEIRREIEIQAENFGIDPNLIEAIVMTESSGHPNTSRYETAFYSRYIIPLKLFAAEGMKRATSYGLMQIMYQSAIEDGYKGTAEDLLKITIGLECGVKHLRKKYEKYYTGNIDFVIAAYNAGSPRFVNGKFSNQEYVDKVHKYLKQIREV